MTATSRPIYYHNPRCGTSRNGMDLLKARGIDARIRLYLDEPLTEAELRALLAKLRMKPSQLIRRKEEDFAAMGLDGADEETILRAMVTHPKLIERPILEIGDKAALGRPVSNLAELLDA